MEEKLINQLIKKGYMSFVSAQLYYICRIEIMITNPQGLIFMFAKGFMRIILNFHFQVRDVILALKIIRSYGNILTFM